MRRRARWWVDRCRAAGFGPSPDFRLLDCSVPTQCCRRAERGFYFGRSDRRPPGCFSDGPAAAFLMATWRREPAGSTAGNPRKVTPSNTNTKRARQQEA